MRLDGPQGRSGRVRKISSPSEFDPWTAQPAAIRYTDCGILTHKCELGSQVFAFLVVKLVGRCLFSPSCLWWWWTIWGRPRLCFSTRKKSWFITLFLSAVELWVCMCTDASSYVLLCCPCAVADVILFNAKTAEWLYGIYKAYVLYFIDQCNIVTR